MEIVENRTSSKLRPLVSGMRKKRAIESGTPSPKKTKPTFGPRSPASGLIMYGVTKPTTQALILS